MPIENEPEVVFHVPTPIEDITPQKIRKNKVFQLPVNVRAEINSLIDDGKGCTVIYRFLTSRYTDLEIPVEATIADYIKDYRASRLEEEFKENTAVYGLEKDLEEIEKELKDIKNRPAGLHIDKVKLLEGLATKCIFRAQLIEKQQKIGKKFVPAIEQALIRYISEARSLVETMYKYTDEAKMEEDIYKMVQEDLLRVLSAVRSTILEVCPEKFPVIKEKLQHKLQLLKEVDKSGSLEAESAPESRSSNRQ